MLIPPPQKKNNCCQTEEKDEMTKYNIRDYTRETYKIFIKNRIARLRIVIYNNRNSSISTKFNGNCYFSYKKDSSKSKRNVCKEKKSKSVKY